MSNYLKHFWIMLFSVMLPVMPLMGQTTNQIIKGTNGPAPVQTAPPPVSRPQTAILGAGSGFLVMSPQHQVVGFCQTIVGKKVSGCEVIKGHTVTEVIQGMLNSLVPDPPATVAPAK